MNKNKRGITLIALIITIIVMLILVGVTINIAVNGGIFEKAREAARKTEAQVIYDEIVSSMVVTNSGMIDPKETFLQAKAALEAEGREVFTLDDEANSVKLLIVVNGEGVDTDEEEDIGEPGMAYGENDDYNYFITYSRILKNGDCAADENGFPILTWADFGITNLTKNVNYTSEDETVTFYFKEDPEEGVEICLANGTPGGEDPANNSTLLIIAAAGLLTCPEENILDGTDSLHSIFKFMGDTVILNPGTDNIVLTKE